MLTGTQRVLSVLTSACAATASAAKVAPNVRQRTPCGQPGSGTRFRGKGTCFRGKGTRFRGKGTRFRGKGARFRGKGTGFRDKGTGFRDKGTGFRGKGTGFRIGISRKGIKGIDRSIGLVVAQMRSSKTQWRTLKGTLKGTRGVL